MMNLFNKVKRYFEFKRKNIKAWRPCNIYPTAIIGKNVSIGRFAEIGNHVVIGNNVRIGAGAFIPEGVTIGDNVFIGPHAILSNDMYPPAANKADWGKIVIHDSAAIGAGVCIRPDVVIGKGSLIGMGSVVTRNIPAGEVWSGVPAKFMRKNNLKGGTNGSRNRDTERAEEPS